MAQNQQLGTLGQYLTVNTAGNTVTLTSQIAVGNSTMHSTGFTIGNTSVHSTGVTIDGLPLSSSSYPGTANNANNLGGVAAASYVNTAGDYTISGIHTYNANIVISSGLIANGGVGVAGQALQSNGSSVYWANVTSVAGSNTQVQFNDEQFSNASAGFTFDKVSNTLTVGNTVVATNFTGTANVATYLGNSSATVANVASWITTNAAAAYSNSTSYTDLKAANAYTNATTFAANATNISSGTLAEARLPYRMNQNIRSTDSITLGNLTLTGNLYVGSNVNVIGANNLSLIDNMIYLNANNTVANPDLGFAANYNDGSYHHTGFFRDASDGYWKVFDNYDPEPDANVYIDTTNTSFHLANFQANGLALGNTSTNWVVGNTSGVYTTGTINAASHTVGSNFIANTTTLKVAGTIDIASSNVLNQTLTDGVTVSWNTASGQVATVTLGGNRTMAAPSNLKIGTYILHVVQDATGSRTLTWNSVFKWPAGVAPVLTTTANARDIFSFISDGTNLYGSYLTDVK